MHSPETKLLVTVLDWQKPIAARSPLSISSTHQDKQLAYLLIVIQLATAVPTT